jgi:hypothetical protein
MATFGMNIHGDGLLQPHLQKIAAIKHYHHGIRSSGFFSDVIFHSWYYASIDYSIYTKRDNIDRRSNLSLEEFQRDYGIPNKPVIITDVVTKWPAINKWTIEYLLSKYGNVTFRAENVDLTLENYFQYASNATEESPLYLFDKSFGETCPELLNDFEVPCYFNEDFFRLLGKERPDYRWIIIGPQRSGSTFHKDPVKAEKNFVGNNYIQILC